MEAFWFQNPLVFWELWLKNISYVSIQHYNDFKSDSTCSKVPKILESASLQFLATSPTLHHFLPFQTIFDPNSQILETCGWKMFTRSGSNFMNKLWMISEVPYLYKSKKMEFLPFSTIFIVFGQVSNVLDPKAIISWKLWLKSISSVRIQLYKQLQEDLRGSNEVATSQFSTIFTVFSPFLIIFVNFKKSSSLVILTVFFV